MTRRPRRRTLHLLARGLGTAALALLLPLMPARAEETPPDAPVVQVGLIHVNDVYQIGAVDPQGPRGGLARLATLVHRLQQQAPGTLFVFGGDTLSPSVASGVFKGKQMMAAWNALGIDLAVPGNHEFDFGPEVLRQRLAESRFPWLAANLLADTPLPAVQASALRTVNGVPIGFVGLLTPETATLSKPGPTLRFAELLTTAQREAAALRARGAVAVIGLTHCNLDEDRRLAASGAFDLILGGHEHQLITEQVARTPIFKAGADARDALHVRLRFALTDTGPQLAGIAWDILPVDGRWAEDPAIAQMEKSFDDQLAQLLQTPIATTAVALDARSETLRRQESNIGDLAADAVREAMGSDIALLNAGGLRSDRLLGPGPLTRRDILALLPFQNPLVLLSISGAQLRQVLEYGLDRRITLGQSGAFPLIAGMILRYAPDAAKGQRIRELRIGGEPVQAGRRYTLATSNYLAGGGDGYPLLNTLPVLRPAEGSPNETEVLIEALQRAGNIAPQPDGRLRPLP